jgi:trk system potassium uptake protein TrkA
MGFVSSPLPSYNVPDVHIRKEAKVRIAVVGAGQVGFNLARRLSRESHEIILVDYDYEKTKRAQEILDISATHGSGSNISTLVEAGVNGADMLVAVTDSDEVNVVSCLLADRLKVKTKIARVRDEQMTSPESIAHWQKLGIDMMINPEQLTAQRIAKLIHQANATDLIDFFDGRIQILGMYVDDHIDFLGKPLKEITQRPEAPTYRTVAIRRRGQTIIPTGEDMLLPGDQIYVIAETEVIPQVMELAGLKPFQVQNVMILGGGRVGLQAARLLEKDFNVKIIESRRGKSVQIARELDSSLVIHGDGTEVDLLAQEGITDMDAFVAATGDDETNIIATLVVKHLKVRRTIALVNNTDYIPITPTIGLDTTVSTQLITVGAILRYIRRGEILSVKTLQGVEAEAIELVPKKNSKITRKALKDIRFPKGAIVGAVMREDQVFVPVGDSKIQRGDKTVVFAQPEAVCKVEAFFD